jgi:hypothetical protein
MQKPIALIAALSVFVPPVDGSTAQGRKHPAKRYPAHFSYRPDYPVGNRRSPHNGQDPRPKSDGWFPRDAGKLPIGTRKWFDQMLRENRRNPG